MLLCTCVSGVTDCNDEFAMLPDNHEGSKNTDLMNLSSLARCHPELPSLLTTMSTLTWRFLQEAVKLRPNYADAYTGMGVSLKELGRKNDAVACLQQVVRLRPTCALSLGNLAGICPPPQPHPPWKCQVEQRPGKKGGISQ